MNDRPPSKRAMDAYARLARPSDAETGTLHKQLRIGDRLSVGDGLDLTFKGIYGSEVLADIVKDQKALSLAFPLDRDVEFAAGITITVTGAAGMTVKVKVQAPRSMKISHMPRGGWE